MIRFAKFTLLVMACFWLAQPVLAQEEKKEEGTDESTQVESTESEASDDAAEVEQESTESAESPTLDTSFAGLLARYETTSKKLDDLKRMFDEAVVPEDATNFRDQYSRMVDEANLLVEEIRVAGIALLDEGSKDEKVMETLTGLVINDAFFERDVKALSLGQKLIDSGIDVALFEKATDAERLEPSGKEVLRELVVRCKEGAADDLPRVKLTTPKGEIVLELFENDAPETVANFISLVKDGFYDGLTFHRVLENFMAQAGCPEGNGYGGPGYNINCECYKPEYRRHFTGSLSMAKGPARNSGGSQFFITFSRSSAVSRLDGKHTVFGRVIEGMDVVNSIQRIDPENPNPSVKADTIDKAEVVRDRGHEYKPTKTGG